MPLRIVTQDLQPSIIALITGLIFIFIGMTATTITGGVGIYVVNTLNESINGALPSEINMFKSNVINLVGTVFVFIGISLLVASVAFIIKALWESVRETGLVGQTG